MAVTLRVVADQLVTPTDSNLAEASSALLHALMSDVPRGCDVAVIVPSGEQHLASTYPGIREVQPASLQRRELAGAWQLGITGTIGGGLIHSPTLLAPLVRHDRANSGSQTVVTLWDADAWESPQTLSKTSALWHKAMLKRAARFADAIIVPTFTMADRISQVHNFGERIRVIAGAVPRGFGVPSDEAARLRDLNLPAAFVAVDGARGVAEALAGAAGGVSDERAVVVFGAPEGSEPHIADLAQAAGIPERHIHVRGALDAADRASVLAHADAVVFGPSGSAWPWRVIEALELGTPVVAADSEAHREVIGDGGAVVPVADLAAAVAGAVGDDADRLRILASDRGRSYSWQSAAEQVWQLHAEL